MFIPFLFELRSRGVPVGVQEAIALARALEQGLHESSLDGFYHVARALLVHREAHLDAFDEAFLSHFRGVQVRSIEIHDELLQWLRDAAARHDLTPEEVALLQDMDPEELFKQFQERLEQQKERHDGGSHWIGTGVRHRSGMADRRGRASAWAARGGTAARSRWRRHGCSSPIAAT